MRRPAYGCCHGRQRAVRTCACSCPRPAGQRPGRKSRREPEGDPGAPSPPDGLDQVLRGPLGDWIRGHLKVENLPPVMRPHAEDEEHPEGDRRNRDDIQRAELRRGILQERPPGGGGGAMRAGPILCNGGCRHDNLQLAKLPAGIRGEPHGGLATEMSRIKRRSSGLTAGREFRDSAEPSGPGTVCAARR